jgi:hypothetical protein
LVLSIVTVTMCDESQVPLTSNGTVTLESLLGDEMLIIERLPDGCQPQRLATA